MKKRKKNQKVEYLLTSKQFLFAKGLFISGFFLLGIFHEFIGCLFTAVELIFLYYLYRKNRRLIVYDNLNFIFLVFIIFMYLFSVIYAIDRGMALLGFISMLSLLLFALIIMQLSNQQRSEIMAVIPLCGMIMLIINALFFLTKFGRDFFYVNNRIGGFFQYPNTFALFLLIGVIITLTKEELKKIDYLLFVGLIIGIILTGSRTVYLITFGFMIYFSIINRQILKACLLMSIGLIIIFLMIVFTGIDIFFVERLMSINLSSSTFLGRLLYYKDGLLAIIKHPLGLGYLGYYYIEPQIQTGVYSIRFIHNDILQLFLDVGILPGLMFVCMIIKSLVAKNVSKLNRLILLAIIVHSLFDFSLQYKSIFFILILSLDLFSGKEKVIYKDNLKIVKTSGVAIASFVSLYCAITMMFNVIGMSEISIQYLPIYTEAMISRLVITDDLDEGVMLANKILKLNKNVVIAYDVLAIDEYGKQNYDLMITYKEKSIDLQKYNINAYDNYVTMLSVAIDYYQDVDQNRYEEYVQKLQAVPIKIESIKNKTSSLAYKIVDQPDLELSNQSKQIIEMFQE